MPTQHETALKDAAEIIQYAAIDEGLVWPQVQDPDTWTWAADAARKILGDALPATTHVEALIAADPDLWHRMLDSPAAEHWRALVKLAIAAGEASEGV